jgi:ATP-dependent DNA helicase RecG
MMDWNIDELLELLQSRDECHQIEAKEAYSELGKSALETISAFSNEPDLGGGYLVLGLKKAEEDLLGIRYDITGVSDPDKIQQELVNVCRNVFNVRINLRITVHEREGCALVVAFIPEAFCRDKPVYIESKGCDDGTFRRLGSSDVRCTREDLEDFYQLRSKQSYESQVLSDVSWEDISSEAVDEYRRLRFQLDSEASELKLDDRELLLSLKMAIKQKGEVLPTIGGLLLFGTKSALRRELPMAARVDYIVVEGTAWVDDSLSSDRYKYAMEYREGLITLMSRLYVQIMGDIPSKFGLKSGALQRSDTPLIPGEVVREGLANALMHRDYRVHQPTLVIRYSNRLEFRNAGYSLKPMEELEEPGSKQRNPLIASVFHELKRVETKGTGIRSMVKKMREAGLSTPPIFESDREKNEFDLILLPHHLLDHSVLEWLSQFKDIELTDAQRRALAFTREIGAITNFDYRQLNGTDTLTASKALVSLRNAKLLVQKGKGNGTYYQLGLRVLDQNFRNELSSSSDETRAPHIYSATPHISLKPEGLTPHISLKPEGVGVITAETIEIPEDLQNEISMLTKKPRYEKLKETIKKLCLLGPLKLNQIAAILGKNPRYLRECYLTKMIQDRELRYLYDQQPAHPQQAYIATSGSQE